MSKHTYRHTITKVEAELDDSFVVLFPGSFELVEKKTPAAKPVEAAQSKKPDSSKEGNK